MQEVLVYSIWTTLHLSQPTIVCNTFHVVKCMWGAWFFSPGQKEKKEDNPLLIRKRLQWSLFHHTPKPSKSLCSQQSHPDLTSQTLECFESFLNVPSKICLQIYCEIFHFSSFFFFFYENSSFIHLHPTNHECNPIC